MPHVRAEQRRPGSGNVLSGMRASAIEQRVRTSVRRAKLKKEVDAARTLSPIPAEAPSQIPTEGPGQIPIEGPSPIPTEPAGLINPRKPLPNAPSPSPTTRREREQEFIEINAAAKKLEADIEVLSDEGLSPTDLQAARDIRQGKEVELAELEILMLEKQSELSTQDALFDIKAERAGLEDAFDLRPLRTTLGEEHGLGAQTFQAVLDLAQNVALSEKEKDEGIDLLLTRRNVSQEIIGTINDMVDTETDLQELLELTDRELLDNAAEFVSPPLAFNVNGVTDSDRFLNDMFNEIAPFLEDAVVHTVPITQATEDLYKSVVLSAMQFGVNEPDTANLIKDLAKAWDVDEDLLTATLRDARVKAEANKQAWDEALVADQATPGGGVLIAALWQAGELVGFNPEQLEMAAKSRDLHVLIDVKSGGVSGRKKSGNIAGVGGLTLAMYEHLMGEEWTPKRGMQWELEALLGYIDEFFQGDALMAVRFYRETGEWGGSGTISGGLDL